MQYIYIIENVLSYNFCNSFSIPKFFKMTPYSHFDYLMGNLRANCFGIEMSLSLLQQLFQYLCNGQIYKKDGSHPSLQNEVITCLTTQIVRLIKQIKTNRKKKRKQLIKWMELYNKDDNIGPRYFKRSRSQVTFFRGSGGEEVFSSFQKF